MDIQSIHSISNRSSTTPDNTNKSEHESFWGKDGFTFDDVVDMFNPMHHIPVVSKLYSQQTQDVASEGSKLIGGVLFGGLVGGVTGLVASVTNSAVRHETHQDLADHVLAMAEDSVYPKAEGSVYPKAEESAQVVSPKPIETNPFFAQLFQQDVFEEDVRASSYASDTERLPSQRTKDWGIV